MPTSNPDPRPAAAPTAQAASSIPQAAPPTSRPSLLLPALLVVGLVAVVGSASWLEAWRSAEREARLRRTHTLEGTIDEHPAFRSTLLGNTRAVAVYLPRQYPIEPDRRFPVLYVQDGENAFDGATATIAGQEWRLDETAERLTIEQKIEPLIIVAVASAGQHRGDEYAPTRDPVRGVGGEADGYGRMLVEELKPWIDSSYRTQPGRETTGIAGTAQGGLAALYVGLRYPAVFSRIGALSPDAAWDRGFIARFVDTLPTRPETRIWLDVGGREAAPAIEATRHLRDALVRKGWREGGDLRYLEAAGAHGEIAAWAQRLPDVLTFLDPPVLLPVPAPAATAGAPPPATGPTSLSR